MSTTKLSPAQLVEAVGQLTVLEAAEFVKLAEEKFGVKAAAAAPAAAAGGHAVPPRAEPPPKRRPISPCSSRTPAETRSTSSRSSAS